MAALAETGFLMTLLWVLLGVGIGVAATVVYLTNRSIVPPILKMVGAMGQLAGGDHSVAIPATDKKDEIGLMARAVLIFKENMIKAKELADKEAEAIKARVARAARVNELTEAFDASISTVLRSVASASTELQATASSDDGDGGRNQQPGDRGRGCDRRGFHQRADRCGGVGGAGEFGHRDQPAGGAIGGDRAEGRRRRPTAPTRRCRVCTTDAASIGDVVKLINEIAGADQSARAQCHDRGGARRRGGPGLCRGGVRGQEPRRTDRQGDRTDRRPDRLDPEFVERGGDARSGESARRSTR